jgi:hypothetical protein
MAVETLRPSETKLVAGGGWSVVNERLQEVFNEGLL